MNPLLIVILTSIAVSLGSTIIYKLTTNQVVIKKAQKVMKILNVKAKQQSLPDPKIQKQIWNNQMIMIKGQMVSMLCTIVPMLFVLGWLSTTIGTQKVINIGFIKLGWFASYVIFSMAFSWLIRKIW